MVQDTPDQASVAALRRMIQDYIQQQLESKLESVKADDIEKIQEIREKYQKDSWLEDVANRGSKLQLATHAVKYTHPKTKGATNVLYEPDAAIGEITKLVGTHTLKDKRAFDVVGNAAYLDTYKFFKLEFDGKTLLERARAADPVLIAALSDDPLQGKRWAQNMAAIADNDTPTASHALTKQVYFPLTDGGYHLLAPLFPSSLVHTIHHRVTEDRFGEAAKTAREARRAEKMHSQGYREYPNLAIQNFGGTKPQNISQLNSERRGENWLLASLPPVWRSESVRAPWYVETVFSRVFPRRPAVKELTRTLREFLVKVAADNNVRIRQTRAELVSRLIDELLLFTAELQALPAGWSAEADCRLDMIERYWLDPGRAAQDADFAEQRQTRDWQEDICSRFGNWLNSALQHDKLPLGRAEQTEWKAELEKEFALLREGLVHYG